MGDRTARASDADPARPLTVCFTRCGDGHARVADTPCAQFAEGDLLVLEDHRFGTRTIFSDRRILASSRASRHAS